MKKNTPFDAIVLGVVALLTALAGVLWWQVDTQGLNPPICSPQMIAAMGPIKLSFSQPMQPDSVEANISLQPKVAGRFSWQENDLLFWPQTALDDGLEYQLSLKAGSLAQNGKIINGTHSCRVKIRMPQVVYETVDLQKGRLLTINLDGSGKKELGHFENPILSYDVSRDGENIVLSVKNEVGGSDLWLLNRAGTLQKKINSCSKVHCEDPVWSPNNQEIVYSKSGIPADTPGGTESPQLWLIRLDHLDSTLLVDGQNFSGQYPEFSPDGEKLAFFDKQVNGIHIVNLLNQKSVLLKANSSLLAWAPDSMSLLYFNEVQELGNNYSNALLYLIAEQKSEILLDQYRDQFVFGLPVWTPDGEWITMAVRLSRIQSSPNKQLLMVKRDGTAVKTITENPLYTQSAYHWSMNGEWLVFQRYQLGASDAKPDIVLWNKTTENTTVLVEGGGTPEWLP